MSEFNLYTQNILNKKITLPEPTSVSATTKQDEQSTVHGFDKICRVIVPILYIIFCSTYWLYYVISRKADSKNDHGWVVEITEAVVHMCSIEKIFFRNFVKFTGKHLCQSLFFKNLKVSGLGTRKLIMSCSLQFCHDELSVVEESLFFSTHLTQF